MNAIILSALLGVVMMFSGIITKNRSAITATAIAGLLLLLAGNLADSYGVFVLHINTHEMLSFEKFGLFFNSIAFTATLVYFILSGKDIEKAGVNVAEYYALIFFVLCGVSILSSFNGLLMLFLGIEIMSIPLYILTGADKRNLKSNEAAFKVFSDGFIFNRHHAHGYRACIWSNRFFRTCGKYTSSKGTTGLPISASYLEVAGHIIVVCIHVF